MPASLAIPATEVIGDGHQLVGHVAVATLKVPTGLGAVETGANLLAQFAPELIKRGLDLRRRLTGEGGGGGAVSHVDNLKASEAVMNQSGRALESPSGRLRPVEADNSNHRTRWQAPGGPGRLLNVPFGRKSGHGSFLPLRQPSFRLELLSTT